jgi:hypothetical protein
LLSTVTLMSAVLLAAILQGAERPGSVYSITPQWLHLMVLQYVAVSFLLPSVSTANINTVQYPKPHQQYATPTIPAVVISRVLLCQSNIMAVFVCSHRCLFWSANIQKPMSHILQFYSAWSLAADPLRTPAQNVQLPTWSSTILSLLLSPSGGDNVRNPLAR